MTKTPKKVDAAPLDAWGMASGILTGIYQATEVAEAELAAALQAGNQNPFAPGTSQARQLIEALEDARKTLEADMRALARSSRLAMPDVQAIRRSKTHV